MELTRPTAPSRRVDGTDAALLAAYGVLAALGTWQGSLLVNDAVVYLVAAWLGDAWDLGYGQVPSRAVSSLLTFGPAWAFRAVFAPSSDVFIVAAHALCFAALLVPWLILRVVEPQRIFSRLYLAIVLVLAYFPSEIVVGTGLWMIWLALFADPARSRATHVVTTGVIAPALVLTHPGVALLSATFAAIGGVLILSGRPFPRRLAVATAAMGAFLAAAYFATASLLPPSYLLDGQHGKYNYINPIWLMGTLAFFPGLAMLWLLLVAPGLETAAVRWRLPPLAVTIIGIVGLWFAVNGTNLLTWMFARQTAPYALALALALALASPPSAWLATARRSFAFFAAIVAAASVSYTIDLFLVGRAADVRLAPPAADVPAPPRFVEATQPIELIPLSIRTYFKWAAGQDYVRDIVVPDYGGQRMAFAFYTFFRSDRQAVLFRPLDRPGEWIPFECAAVERAMRHARDAIDGRMLGFIRERYCA
jgi:hypothetical protein